ncbi:MAG TPA: carboxypeptidase-like regulatory domain-containing protein [Kofleriaceae bacterium]
MKVVPILTLAAACAAAQHPRPTRGSIGGLARDQDSGDPVAKAQIHLRADGELTASHAVVTAADGSYAIPRLAPGNYTLTASFAGQPIDIDHIAVHAGDTTVVDVTFTLGRPEPLHVDFGDPKDGEIARFRSSHVAARAAIIEGSVTDSATRAPVPGAAVTATSEGGGAGSPVTLETVTDDLGHYRFEAVVPGAYTVSAYYSIGGRGQIEIRRSDIEVDGGGGVIVPLWVELEKP